MGCRPAVLTIERVWLLKVMVTGGAGFIGSHTVDGLIETGADVFIVDNLSTGKRANLNPAAGFGQTDIVSGRLEEVFRNFRPDFVIHLAAQVSVPRSLADPVQDCLTNVAGTVNLLENCRRYGVKKVVYASSAAVYGNPGGERLAETDSKLPLSFYGVSKLAPEYYLEVFNHLYGLGYTVLRYANVYGPRQDAEGEGGVVAIFASRIMARQCPQVFGDGEQTRDFIYVGDVAEANIRALENGDRMIFNIGTGIPVSVNRLFKTMTEIAGINLEPAYAAAREGDIRHSCMDIGNAVTALGWKPVFSMTEGLTKTLDFYRQKTVPDAL